MFWVAYFEDDSGLTYSTFNDAGKSKGIFDGHYPLHLTWICGLLLVWRPLVNGLREPGPASQVSRSPRAWRGWRSWGRTGCRHRAHISDSVACSPDLLTETNKTTAGQQNQHHIIQSHAQIFRLTSTFWGQTWTGCFIYFCFILI